VQVVDEDRYGRPPGAHLATKIAHKLLWKVSVRELGEAILRQYDDLRPHLIVVYKGMLVAPEVLQAIRAQGGCLVNVYPDVSVLTLGPLIARALRLYAHVFTTKSFGMEDMDRLAGSGTRRKAVSIDSTCSVPPVFAFSEDQLANVAGRWCSPAYHEGLRLVLRRH